MDDYLVTADATVLIASLPVGWIGEWHGNPKPQWVVPLSGRWFVETTDGTRVEMGPGEAPSVATRTRKPTAPDGGGIAQAPSATHRLFSWSSSSMKRGGSLPARAPFCEPAGASPSIVMDGFEIIDPRFRRFVLPNAPLERLADGLRWLEGPVWFADMRCLLVSDIPNDRIMRWTHTGGIEVFRQPAGFPNRQTREREGRLITCSHHGRCVLRTELYGEVMILAARFEGKRLNSPNDVVIKSDGTIWFSILPTAFRPTTREVGRTGSSRRGRTGWTRAQVRWAWWPTISRAKRPVLLSGRAPPLHCRDRPVVRRGPESAYLRLRRRREQQQSAQRPGISRGDPGQRRRHSVRRGRPRLE